jgi:glutamyl-tRNA synthetase
MVNTPPQILLYQAFGARIPAFAHLPMMLAASGEKLSKRHGAVSVTEYRDQGYSPHAVLNYLARFGWSHGDQEVFSLEELIAAFDWEHCNRSDGKFDAKKFLAIDHEHLKTPGLTGDDEYTDRVLPFLEKRGLSGLDRRHVSAAIPLIRERATTFVDAADRLDFVFREAPVVDPAAAAKFLGAKSVPLLRDLAGVIENADPWTPEGIEARVTSWLTERGIQMKDVAQAARVALTGRAASPGLYDVIAVLGRARAVERLTSRLTSPALPPTNP